MSDAKPAPNERQATRRIDTAGPDYGKPTGPVGRFRARLRVFLENLKVEFFTMGVVIIYMLLIFTDLMLADDPKVDSEAKGKPWTNTFKYVDMVFLSIFTAELLIRLFAFGYFYCLAPLNTVDGMVVLISFGLQAWLGSGIAPTPTPTPTLTLNPDPDPDLDPEQVRRSRRPSTSSRCAARSSSCTRYYGLGLGLRVRG